MPDPYTYVSKPTSSVYTYTNTQGKEQYDQADLIYDDPDVFYNGVNVAAYTNISKPISSTYTLVSKPT